jgi:hypothetical protein
MSATGAWPVYQYVQAKLDDLGLDIDEVFASLPRFSHNHLTYSLIRRDQGGREEEPVKLTIAGMAHLPQFASTVEMFLRVVNPLADRRASAPFEPGRIITVEISGAELVADLGLDGEPHVELLPELLKASQPPGTGCSRAATLAGFTSRAASSVVSVGYATSTTTSPECAPGSCRPHPHERLSQSPHWVSAAAFDYLDVVWQLKYGHQLVRVPSVERAARLTLPVSTPEEFDNRLSALGEMFKELNVKSDKGSGPFDKMRQLLLQRLPSESHPAVQTAIETLLQVTHLRNAGLHIGATVQAAAALPALVLQQHFVTQTLSSLVVGLPGAVLVPSAPQGPRPGHGAVGDDGDQVCQETLDLAERDRDKAAARAFGAVAAVTER